MKGTDDSLFSRWSRRKLAGRQRGESEAAPQALPDSAGEADAPEVEESSEEELLERLGLPDPDTLEPDGDFKAFMAREVPAFLRRRALRRLWRINPALANLDGLVDYGEDFRNPALVPGAVATAYRVGKGMMEKVGADSEPQQPAEAEKAVNRSADLTDPDRSDEEVSAAPQPAAAHQEKAAAPERDSGGEADSPPSVEGEEMDGQAVPAPPRRPARMQFRRL